MNAALGFQQVACVRGGRLLFEDISFALGPGEAMTVTGANGAGKSSLLRVAAGLLGPSSGRFDRQGRTALVDDRDALDANLPLASALAYWARIDGGSVVPALAAVSLSALAEVPVRLLSSGQRRRAAIARAVASQAEIWLFDEPANGLDAASVGQLETVIATHRAQGGIVVVATHQALDMPDAKPLTL